MVQLSLSSPGLPDCTQETRCSHPRLSRCAGAEGKLLPTQGQVAAVGATAGGSCSPLLSPSDGPRELEGGKNMYVSKIPQMPRGQNKLRPGEVASSVSGMGEVDEVGRKVRR